MVLLIYILNDLKKNNYFLNIEMIVKKFLIFKLIKEKNKKRFFDNK